MYNRQPACCRTGRSNEEGQTCFLSEAFDPHDLRGAAHCRNGSGDGRGNSDRGCQSGIRIHALAVRMDLERRDWAGAGGHELVEPPVLGPGHGTPERDGIGARRFGLGSLAWSRAPAALQPRLLALRMAWMDGFRMRRSGRYG